MPVDRLQTIVQKLFFVGFLFLDGTPYARGYDEREATLTHEALCLLRYFVGVKSNTRRVSRQTDR